MLNEHVNVQPKVRLLKELTDSTECNINDSQNDIIEALIHVQLDAILLKEGACKSGHSDQIIDNGQNQSENMTQTEVQIESGHQSLRKIECTHCKIIFTYEYKLQNSHICAYDMCKFIKLQNIINCYKCVNYVN